MKKEKKMRHEGEKEHEMHFVASLSSVNIVSIFLINVVKPPEEIRRQTLNPFARIVMLDILVNFQQG